MCFVSHLNPLPLNRICLTWALRMPDGPHQPPATFMVRISISVPIAFPRRSRARLGSEGNYACLCKFWSSGGSFVFVFAGGIQEREIKALSPVTSLSHGGGGRDVMEAGQRATGTRWHDPLVLLLMGRGLPVLKMPTVAVPRGPGALAGSLAWGRDQAVPRLCPSE